MKQQTKKKIKKYSLLVILFLSLFFTNKVFADVTELKDFYFYLDQDISPKISGDVFENVVEYSTSGYYYLENMPNFSSSTIENKLDYGVTFNPIDPLSPQTIQNSGYYLYIADLNAYTSLSTQYYLCYDGNYNDTCSSVINTQGKSKNYTSPYSNTRISKIPLSDFNFGATSSLINKFSLISTTDNSLNHKTQLMVISNQDIDINSYIYYFDALADLRALNLVIPNTSTTTRMLGISPIENTTVPSNYIDLVYRYYLNTETDPDITKISISLCPKSYTVEDCTTLEQTDLDFNVYKEDTIQGIELPIDKLGLYEVSIAFWNGEYNKTCSWYQPFCDETQMRFSAGDLWYFNLIEESGTGTTPPVKSDYDFFKDDDLMNCEITQIGCNLKKAFLWAFEMKTSYFDEFYTLQTTLSTKAPFGYIGGIYSSLNGLTNNTENPTFTLSGIGVINTMIFAPMRTALNWLFYFLFAFVLFHRFKDIRI